MRLINKILFLLCFVLMTNVVSSQTNTRVDSVRISLENKSKEIQGLNNDLHLRVSQVTVSELISLIAKQHKISIVFREEFKEVIHYNFEEGKVKDLLVYLCEAYNLEINFFGKFIEFKKLPPPQRKTTVARNRVKYDSVTKLLSVDIRDDSVFSVFREITQKTGVNIAAKKIISSNKISGFVKDLPIVEAIEQLCISNDLELQKQDDSYVIDKMRVDRNSNSNQNNSLNNNNVNALSSINIQYKEDLISIECVNSNLREIIKALSAKFEFDYVFLEEVDEQVTININGYDLDECLKFLFIGTEFAIKRIDGVYIIGSNSSQEMTETEVIKLNFRKVEGTLELLPASLTKDLFIKEYNNINGYVVSGPKLKVEKIKEVITEIDQIAKLITIDISIISVKKSKTINTGVESSVGSTTNQSNTTGTISPGLNLDIGTTIINSILRAVGFSSSVAANISPNLSFNVYALENNQNIKVEKTRKVSTLNGEETSIDIDDQEYYKETNSNLIGITGGNAGLETNVTYKSVTAKNSIKLTPFVSNDGYITLTIELTQSEFTPRIEEGAPPGVQNLVFSSKIKVKNGDVVLLGGIDELSKVSSGGGGIPFLARIPIIKWFFGPRFRETSKETMNILIRPIITE